MECIMATGIEFNVMTGEKTEFEYEPPPVVPQALNYSNAMEELRAHRDRLLTVVNGLMISYVVDGNTAAAQFCRGVVDGLKDTPAHPTLADGAHTTVDSFKEAAKTLWAGMVADAPVELKTEFYRYAGRI
jgi:hypothetical protein